MAKKLRTPPLPAVDAGRQPWTAHFVKMLLYMNRLIRTMGAEVIEIRMIYKHQVANDRMQGTMIQVERCPGTNCERLFHTAYATGKFDDQGVLEITRRDIMHADSLVDRFIDVPDEDIEDQVAGFLESNLATPATNGLDPVKIAERLKRVLGEGGFALIAIDENGVHMVETDTKLND